MKKILTVLLLLLSCNICFIVTGCKKQPNYTTARDILTHHRWRVINTKINGQMKPFDSCSLDNFMIFNEDSTGYEDDENTVCTVNFPRKDYWHWALSNDNDTLFLIFPGLTDVLPITSLTNSSFSYLSYMAPGQGTDVYETFFIPG